MNPEIKELWLAALRSGEYTQTQSALAANGSYCCLGVLCEVAAQQGVPVAVQPVAVHDGNTFKSYDGETGILPNSVRGWAGLENGNPLTNVKRYVTRNPYEGDELEDIELNFSLAELNDEGWSFADIADIIERDL